MPSIDALRELKTCSARNRCQAHIKYLRGLSARTQTSPAIQHVIKTLQFALKKLDSNLAALESDPVPPFLDEDQIEATIQFKSGLLIRINAIIGLIDVADISGVPGELVAPLRIEIRRQFPDGELIIVPAAELNYSIVEITVYLKRLLADLTCEIPTDLPPKIFRVAIPKVEFDQALLHCILAHEIGHPLFRELEIEQKVSPISVGERRINDLYEQLKATVEKAKPDGTQRELPFGEVMFKAFVTENVNRIIPTWVEEIGSDMFGFMTFGPAYVLAFIYFCSSVFRLNSASESHPPPRFRIKTLLDRMEVEFPPEGLGCKTREFLNTWREIARREPINLNPLQQIALDTIQEQGVVDRLYNAIQQSLPDDKRYSKARYAEEVGPLTELIDAMIPPAEILSDKGYKPTTIPGILNAGWECFLAGLDKFRECLPEGECNTVFELNHKFNEFLIKSMELNQIRRSWDSARNDVISGKN